MARLQALLFALLIAACAAQSPPPGEAQVRYGKIARIDNVQIDGDHHLGVGAIIGAVAGGLIGYNIGGGTGRDVATVAGVLGGGFIGNKVQNKYADRRPGQYITVELQNGVAVGITQPADPTFQVGDVVRIDGAGEDARVAHR